MIRGLYGAGSALQAASLNQDTIAENIAQATTPGFRRQVALFETMASREGGGEEGNGVAGVRQLGTRSSFLPGPMQQTGDRFDLALSGDVFFVLEGSQGPVYTRNGCFELDATGQLRSKNGLAVRGQGGGPISLPLGAANIVVDSEGRVRADGQEVGQLEIARFANTDQLQRVGTTVYGGPPPEDPDPGTYRVLQGYREGSNVQVVQEMVAMMIGMRQYEAAQRSLKALGEVVGMQAKAE